MNGETFAFKKTNSTTEVGAASFYLKELQGIEVLDSKKNTELFIKLEEQEKIITNAFLKFSRSSLFLEKVLVEARKEKTLKSSFLKNCFDDNHLKSDLEELACRIEEAISYINIRSRIWEKYLEEKKTGSDMEDQISLISAKVDEILDGYYFNHLVIKYFIKFLEEVCEDSLLLSAVDFERGYKISQIFFNKIKDDFKKASGMILQIRNEIWTGNLRLTLVIAKKFYKKEHNFIDLVQEGNIGLLKAFNKFNYRMGFSFNNYASWWVKQAISRYKENDGFIRVPPGKQKALKIICNTIKSADDIKDALTKNRIFFSDDVIKSLIIIAEGTLSLDYEYGEDEDVNLANRNNFVNCAEVERMHNAQRRDFICDNLADLSPRQQLVIRLRFGIDDTGEHTLDSVGAIISRSRERIRQIEEKALKKLKDAITKKHKLVFAELI